jgi:hypothetical protein
MREEQARRKAEFCVATRMSPTEYEALTLYEYRAFIEALGSSRGETEWPQL